MSVRGKSKTSLPAKMETEQQTYDTYEWCKAGLRQLREAVSTTATPSSGIRPRAWPPWPRTRQAQGLPVPVLQNAARIRRDAQGR
jgi:hypothetical protein